MSKSSKSWCDTVEESEIIEKTDKTEKTEKPDKTEKTDKFEKTDRTDKTERSKKSDKFEKNDRTDSTDRTDRTVSTDRTNSTDKTDSTERTKYFPYIPCWYLVNSFQCKQANCYFNHNSAFIKTHKDKREHSVCHLYLKCKDKCNKFHNMDELMELYNSANRKLNAVDNIMKT